MKKLSLAYFGSPDFSAVFLERLLTDKDLLQLIEVKLVATQKDQPTGRDLKITPTPVKQIAKKYSLSIFDQNIENVVKELKGVDLALIYFYGQIIPNNVLSIPTHGFGTSTFPPSLNCAGQLQLHIHWYWVKKKPPYQLFRLMKRLTMVIWLANSK